MNLFILTVLTLSAFKSQADIPSMMKDLVKMRGELESLNREMDAAQKEKQAELDLWTSKKLELEASVQKETLRKLQLDEKVTRLARRVKSESRSNPQAKTELLSWINKAEIWVNNSVPYRKAQRLETLSALKERTERGFETYESLSAELWMFYESEFKMATDNEFRIVDLETEKGPQKAEVARLGLYAMFSRTPDGVLRQSLIENGQWVTRTLPADRETDVVRLMNNMKSKKESGLYELPIEKEIL